MGLGVGEMGKTAPCFGDGGASSEEMDEGRGSLESMLVIKSSGRAP